MAFEVFRMNKSEYFADVRESLSVAFVQLHFQIISYIPTLYNTLACIIIDLSHYFLQFLVVLLALLGAIQFENSIPLEFFSLTECVQTLLLNSEQRLRLHEAIVVLGGPLFPLLLADELFYFVKHVEEQDIGGRGVA